MVLRPATHPRLPGLWPSVGQVSARSLTAPGLPPVTAQLPSGYLWPLPALWLSRVTELPHSGALCSCLRATCTPPGVGTRALQSACLRSRAPPPRPPPSVRSGAAASPSVITRTEGAGVHKALAAGGHAGGDTKTFPREMEPAVAPSCLDRAAAGRGFCCPRLTPTPATPAGSQKVPGNSS